VHALRHVHELLVPGGTLLDLHPVTEGRIEAEGIEIGVVPDPEFIATDLPNVAAGLAQTTGEGLYALEAETTLDMLEHFDTAEELIARHEGPLASEHALQNRVRASRPPFVVREHAVLYRLRAQRRR
jgi:hypothetical protein